MNNVNKGIESTSKIELLSYKVILEDNLFKFGFAERNEDKSEMVIKAEFDLNSEEFKQYFKSLLGVIIEFNEKTGRDLFKEVFDEDV